MKTKSIISRLAGLLANPSKDKQDEIKALRHLLSNLKKKQIKAIREQSLANNAIEQEELQVKLEVICAQRRKGIERILKLRQELKNEA